MIMSYSVLEQQIKALPEEYLEDIANYVQLLQYKIIAVNNRNETPQRIGLGKGLFSVPDDIHFGDDEVQDMFGDYL